MATQRIAENGLGKAGTSKRAANASTAHTERRNGTTAVRENILDAALRLFARQGFSGTTSSALAREAGIAEATMFRHFRSKDEILLALLRKVKGSLLYRVECSLAPFAEGSGLDRVLTAVGVYYELASSPLPEFSVLFRDVLTRRQGNGIEEAARLEVRDAYDALSSLLEKALDAGKLDGSIRADVPGRESAGMLLGAVVGMARAVHFGFVDKTSRMENILREFCLSALASRGLERTDPESSSTARML